MRCGGIRNVRIQHCKFTHAQTFAIYIKSRPGRGAFIEDISAEDLDVSGMVGGFLRLNILNSGIQDQVPVPGDEGIPTIKNFKFSNVRVKDVPVLVDGIAIHPHKPLQGFSLINVTGTAAKGISLANVRGAKLRDLKITGLPGRSLVLTMSPVKGLRAPTRSIHRNSRNRLSNHEFEARGNRALRTLSTENPISC